MSTDSTRIMQGMLHWTSSNLLTPNSNYVGFVKTSFWNFGREVALIKKHWTLFQKHLLASPGKTNTTRILGDLQALTPNPFGLLLSWMLVNGLKSQGRPRQEDQEYLPACRDLHRDLKRHHMWRNEDLAGLEPIGKVFEVRSLGFDFLCVTYSFLSSHQWLKNDFTRSWTTKLST